VQTLLDLLPLSHMPQQAVRKSSTAFSAGLYSENNVQLHVHGWSRNSFKQVEQVLRFSAPHNEQWVES